MPFAALSAAWLAFRYLAVFSSTEPGNALTRGPEEYYVSAPRRLDPGAEILAVALEAEIPPKCKVLIAFRRADSEAELAHAAWSDEREVSATPAPAPGSGDWFQYRLNRWAFNSLRTPRVSEVAITVGRR